MSYAEDLKYRKQRDVLAKHLAAINLLRKENEALRAVLKTAFKFVSPNHTLPGPIDNTEMARQILAALDQ